jgi:hypothetical protein
MINVSFLGAGEIAKMHAAAVDKVEKAAMTHRMISLPLQETNSTEAT